MRISRRLAFKLAFAVLIFFFILSILLSGEEDFSNNLEQEDQKTTSELINSDSLPKEDPQTELQDFNRVATRDGKKLWEVAGKVATYTQTEEKKAATSPEINLQDPIFTYYEDNKPAYFLSAQLAKLILALDGIENVFLQNNVSLKVGEQYTLLTKRAKFQGNTQNIDIPTPVEIAGDGINIQGQTLKGNLKTERFILEGNVKTKISPKNKTEKVTVGKKNE